MGFPMRGNTDRTNAKSQLFELLGIKEHEQSQFMKKRESQGNEKYSDLTIMKSKFHDRFKKLPGKPDDQTLMW